MTNRRPSAWTLFDEIVASAVQRDTSPWQREDDGSARFVPDFDTLRQLLGVPALLGASSQSGIPALALDVWVSYELRRAGFDPDAVWPRPIAPRVLPQDIARLVAALPTKQRQAVQERISERGAGGAASANILGKNYVKQVDVVMSAWATGPELLISTKRMDSSFGKNAANRVEESYGDAKNLRLRHPQAALGFFYALGATALETEPETARWLIDLLAKLGREADAYDAVGLVIIDTAVAVPDSTSEVDLAGPLEPGIPDTVLPETIESVGHHEDLDRSALPTVALHAGAVPAELEPGRFLGIMCNLVLDRTPINFHREARARRHAAAG